MPTTDRTTPRGQRVRPATVFPQLPRELGAGPAVTLARQEGPVTYPRAP